MALQPAAGAKDLNPRQVETNRQLTERLASVYRLWGYDEVSPPRVERLPGAKGFLAERAAILLWRRPPRRAGKRAGCRATIPPSAPRKRKQEPCATIAKPRSTT